MSTQAAQISIPAGNLLYGLTSNLVGGADLPVLLMWSNQDMLVSCPLIK
jgi:hypothetical protein